MEEFKGPVWYEDIERHRQPSLYYLSSEEDPAGPHLICDWNGAPTNFKEFDIDLLSKFIEVNPTGIPENDNGEAEKLQFFEKASPCMTTSYTTPKDLPSDKDNSQFGFLTVPPLVNSLMKRLYHDNLEVKTSKIKSNHTPLGNEEQNGKKKQRQNKS